MMKKFRAGNRVVAGLFLQARSASCEARSAKRKDTQAKQKTSWTLIYAEKQDETKTSCFGWI
jgi:hypothetical protein